MAYGPKGGDEKWNTRVEPAQEQEPITPQALKALGFVTREILHTDVLYQCGGIGCWMIINGQKWIFRGCDIPGPTSVSKLRDLCRMLGITLSASIVNSTKE